MSYWPLQSNFSTIPPQIQFKAKLLGKQNPSIILYNIAFFFLSLKQSNCVLFFALISSIVWHRLFQGV